MLRSACIVCAIAWGLAGCTPSMAVRPSKPVIVTRVQYEPLPPYLLQPCNIPHPAVTTWSSLAQASNTIYTALLNCAAQVQAIAQTQTPHKGRL